VPAFHADVVTVRQHGDRYVITGDGPRYSAAFAVTASRLSHLVRQAQDLLAMGHPAIAPQPPEEPPQPTQDCQATPPSQGVSLAEMTTAAAASGP